MFRDEKTIRAITMIGLNSTFISVSNVPVDPHMLILFQSIYAAERIKIYLHVS